jgi:phosphoserine phosphatase
MTLYRSGPRIIAPLRYDVAMGRLLSSIDELWSLPALSPDAALPPDVVRAAVFDADHCLWAADIGDAAFAAAAAAGLIDDATWRGPVRAWASDWDLRLDDDPTRGVTEVMAAAASGQLTSTAMARGLPPSGWKADLYAMQAWVYAGRTPNDIEAHGERLFATGFAERIYGDMQRVVTGLIERGVEVWIASASHRALVVPGARRLGIDPARVLGMEPVVVDGVTVARLHHSTYGPGKAAVALAALRARPLLAFGDSVLSTDQELLAAAHVGVAVATSGDNRRAALADDHLLLLDPRP